MSILSQIIDKKMYCLSNDEPLLKNCNDLSHNTLENLSKTDDSIYQFQDINNTTNCIGKGGPVSGSDSFNILYLPCNSDGGETKFKVTNETDTSSNVAFSKTSDSFNNLKVMLFLTSDTDKITDILINTLYEPKDSGSSILKYYYIIKPIKFHLHNRKQSIPGEELTLNDIYKNSNATLECNLYHVIEDTVNNNVYETIYPLNIKDHVVLNDTKIINFEDPIDKSDMNNEVNGKLTTILYFPPKINGQIQREMNDDDGSIFKTTNTKLVDYDYINNIICLLGCKPSDNDDGKNYYFFNYNKSNPDGQMLIAKKNLGDKAAYFSLKIIDNIDNFKFYYTRRNRATIRNDYTKLDLVSYINPNRALKYIGNAFKYEAEKKATLPRFKLIEGFDDVEIEKLKAFLFFNSDYDNIINYLTTANLDNIINNADQEVLNYIEGQSVTHTNYNDFTIELNKIKNDINIFKTNYSNINNIIDEIDNNNFLSNIINYKSGEISSQQYENIINKLGNIVEKNNSLNSIFKSNLSLSSYEITYINDLIKVLNFFKDNDLNTYIYRFYLYTNYNKHILDRDGSVYNKFRYSLNYNDDFMFKFDISPLNSNNYNIMYNTLNIINNINSSYSNNIKNIENYSNADSNNLKFYKNDELFNKTKNIYIRINNSTLSLNNMIEATNYWINYLFNNIYSNGNITTNYYTYKTDDLPILTCINDVIDFVHNENGLIVELNKNFTNNNNILNSRNNIEFNSIDNLNSSYVNGVNTLTTSLTATNDDVDVSLNKGQHLLLLNNFLNFCSTCSTNINLPRHPVNFPEYYNYQLANGDLSPGFSLYLYENLILFFNSFKTKYSDVINTMMASALSDADINIVPLSKVGELHIQESFISSEGYTGNQIISPTPKNFIKLKQSQADSNQNNPIINDIFNTNKFTYDLNSDLFGTITASDLQNFSNNAAGLVAPKAQFDFTKEDKNFIKCKNNNALDFLYVDKSYKHLGNEVKTSTTASEINGTQLQDSMFTNNVNYKNNNDVCNFSAISELIMHNNNVKLRYNNTYHTLYNLNDLNINNIGDDLLQISENGNCKNTNTIETKIFENISDGSDYINSLHSYSGTENQFTQSFIDNCNNNKKYYLSNSNDKVRLAIINGKLKLIFKIHKIKDLTNSKKSSINQILDDNKNEEVYLYKNKKYNNHIRSNFNKFVYVDSHKKIYNIPHINKNNNSYKPSTAKYDIIDKTTTEDTIYGCTNDVDCIGYIPTNDATKVIKINNDNLKDIYISENGKYFFQKKYSIHDNNDKNIKSLSHISDVEKTQFVNSTDYTNKYKNSVINSDIDEFNESSLIYNILKKVKNNYETKREDNDKLLNNLIEKFNKLNENEINIINDTNNNLREMKGMLSDYKNTINKIEKNKKDINMIKGRYSQFKDLNDQSQIKMALMGIASITGVIFLLQYMKK